MSDSNFFMEIFDDLLKLNDDEILIIFDVNGAIWFKYRDVLKALDYSDIRHTMVDMKINENNKKLKKIF